MLLIAALWALVSGHALPLVVGIIQLVLMIGAIGLAGIAMAVTCSV